ncbi:DUF3348 family protein [Eionea flava]
MPAQPSSLSFSQSALISGLQSLALVDTKVPHKQFVATVGQFIDFGGAFGLADFLATLPRVSMKEGLDSGVINAKSIQLAYTVARDDGRAHIQERTSAYLSKVAGEAALEEPEQTAEASLKVHQRFYSLQQSEMESRVLTLHRQICRQLTRYSPQLAQLVALDNKLAEILASHSRKAFGAIGHLMTKRFDEVLSRLPDATLDAETLSTFIAEMKMLLLAELDIRLHPTLGLVEALIKEEEQVA